MRDLSEKGVHVLCCTSGGAISDLHPSSRFIGSSLAAVSWRRRLPEFCESIRVNRSHLGVSVSTRCDAEMHECAQALGGERRRKGVNRNAPDDSSPGFCADRSHSIDTTSRGRRRFGFALIRRPLSHPSLTTRPYAPRLLNQTCVLPSVFQLSRNTRQSRTTLCIRNADQRAPGGQSSF
jgi:hypothetical protein